MEKITSGRVLNNSVAFRALRRIRKSASSSDLLSSLEEWESARRFLGNLPDLGTKLYPELLHSGTRLSVQDPWYSIPDAGGIVLAARISDPYCLGGVFFKPAWALQGGRSGLRVIIDDLATRTLLLKSGWPKDGYVEVSGIGKNGNFVFGKLRICNGDGEDVDLEDLGG